MVKNTRMSTKSYKEMSLGLEAIMLDLQQDDLDVQEAVKRYEEGLELIAAMERYLEQAENDITELKAKFTDGGSDNGS